MEKTSRPWRSVLYLPASNARAIEKARSIAADAIIFDLEDAVAPDQKVSARAQLAGELDRGGFGNRACLVRINGLESEWGADDVRAAAGMACDGVLVPKVDAPEDLDGVSADAGHPLWAMIETPKSILNVAQIAAHPDLDGLVLGTNDLAKDLGARFRSDRLPMMFALQALLLGARAAGKLCIDGVYNAFKDDDGLRAECEQGRDLGMDGKTLIHPAQLAIANEIFGPSEDEIATARRQIEAFDEAMAAGQGVAVLDGRIVENLHVEMAKALLNKAQAIAEMETT